MFYDELCHVVIATDVRLHVASPLRIPKHFIMVSTMQNGFVDSVVEAVTTDCVL